MSHKGLCHVCLKSNVTTIINGVTGNPECTSCIKKEVVKMPDLKCYCKECHVHNPIEQVINTNPIELDIKLVETVEG